MEFETTREVIVSEVIARHINAHAHDALEDLPIDKQKIIFYVTAKTHDDYMVENEKDGEYIMALLYDNGIFVDPFSHIKCVQELNKLISSFDFSSDIAAEFADDWDHRGCERYHYGAEFSRMNRPLGKEGV